MTIWMDGAWKDRAAATVSVYDHGLLYGDGVFEGIRAYGARVFRLKAHLDRLFDSAATLMLAIPKTKAEIGSLLEEAVNREAAAGNPDSYIRLVVTRGVGPLGLDPFTCENPSLVIIVDKISLYPQSFYDDGIPVITSAYRRSPSDTLDARVKSLNYLNNIMAKIQARQAGAQEAILLNHEGLVAECSGDNIAVVKNGRVQVPEGYHGALDGITMKAVLELASGLGIHAERSALSLYDVYTADEVFLTGTGAELVPVRNVDGRLIGGDPWKPGKIFTTLREEFRRRVRSDQSWVAGTNA